MKFFCFFLTVICTPALAQLKADFSAASLQGCTPLTVQFQDNSTGSPTSWFWDFGNRVTSTSKNPTVTYTESGSYTVRLIVKNATGQDLEEKRKYINVAFTPLTGFTNDVDSGCFPLQVQFTDTTNTSQFIVKNWLWNFGDGGTSAAQNPSHKFSTAGIFDVSLTVETTDGCSNTFQKISAIKTGSQPKAKFSASPLSGCASVLRQFTNSSTGTLTYSQWKFGDGSTSNETDPLHHYQDTGKLDVQLLVANNGCKDSIERINYIQVNSPVARINIDVNCANRASITFKDNSIDEDSRKWTFGDGAKSGEKSLTHKYAAPGKYTVQLKTFKDGCSDTASEKIYISNISPVVEAVPQKDLYCKGDSIEFIFSTYDTADANSFAWKFGNGDSTFFNSGNDSFYYVYTINGNFKPIGFFKNNERCIDTIPLENLKITGPVADFQSLDSGCTGAGITFNDQSVDNTAPLTEWVWNYDDGTITTYTGPPFVYAYPFPGAYDVNLKVTDLNGCSDTVTHIVTIDTTPVVNAGADTFLCAGQNITLAASGASEYTWIDNGNIICNDCSPVVMPSVTTTYYVKGTTTSNCSAVDSLTVLVQNKEKVMVQPSDAIICSGDSIQLNASGSYFYSWIFDSSLSNTTISNPFARPVTNTIYTVIGKDSNACFSDTASITIDVNPTPTVNFAQRTVQLPIGSEYLLQPMASPDVRAWAWTPATGLSCYNCQNPVAIVDNTNTYTATVTNAAGCSSTDSITLVAICNTTILYVPNTFSPNNDGMNDYFFPDSKSSFTIQSLRIYNRWGQKVFENTNFPTNSYTSGWNGKYNNKDQNADVYIYILQFACADGKTVVKKGNVTLLR